MCIDIYSGLGYSFPLSAQQIPPKSFRKDVCLADVVTFLVYLCPHLGALKHLRQFLELHSLVDISAPPMEQDNNHVSKRPQVMSDSGRLHCHGCGMSVRYCHVFLSPLLFCSCEAHDEKTSQFAGHCGESERISNMCPINLERLGWHILSISSLNWKWCACTRSDNAFGICCGKVVQD